LDSYQHGRLHALHPGTAELRERGGSASRNAARLGKSLIGAEVGLSLVLLVAAGLLLEDLLEPDGSQSRL
jgi:hypothetical protein